MLIYYIDDDDDGVTARRILPAVPRNSVLRRPPHSDASYTQCRSDRALSAEHYATIDESVISSRPLSGNCGQDYQDIDGLIRRDQVDPYLTPVEYSFPAATGPAGCSMPYNLIDTNQTDNGHVYVTPGKPTAVRP